MAVKSTSPSPPPCRSRGWPPDWRRLADKYLGPDYLFPLTLWLVADRGAFTWPGLQVAALFGVLTLAPPKIAYRIFIYRGTLSAGGLQTRPGRLHPYVIAPLLAGLALPLLVLACCFPHRGLLVFYASLVAMVLVASGLMFMLKVSGHAMASAACVAVALVFAASWVWVLLPLLVIIAISRVLLGAHTPWEVLVGALVGFAVPTLFFQLFPVG